MHHAKTVLVKTKIISSYSHAAKMAQQQLHTIDALLDDNEEMDALFREAFDSMTECRKSLDRMRPGAGIRTFTPRWRVLHGVWCPRKREAAI